MHSKAVRRVTWNRVAANILLRRLSGVILFSWLGVKVFVSPLLPLPLLKSL